MDELMSEGLYYDKGLGFDSDLIDLWAYVDYYPNETGEKNWIRLQIYQRGNGQVNQMFLISEIKGFTKR